jgi:hypothetical protein
MLQDFRGLRKFSTKLPNSQEKSTSPRSAQRGRESEDLAQRTQSPQRKLEKQ